MSLGQTLLKVTKQTGETVTFHAYKVALILNLLGVKDDVYQQVMAAVENQTKQPQLTTAQIYNTVLSELKKLDGAAAAAFEQEHIRAEKKWQQAINPSNKINRLIAQEDDIVHENANKDAQVFNTFRDLTAGMVGKSTGLKMLPEDVAKAHLRGDMHWHDLDYSPLSPMTNCCLVDFKFMFEHGYTMGNAQVEQPQSIGTATAQMAQIIANVASSQYGGISINRAD